MLALDVWFWRSLISPIREAEIQPLMHMHSYTYVREKPEMGGVAQAELLA
jgi:hypothetical protein